MQSIYPPTGPRRYTPSLRAAEAAADEHVTYMTSALLVNDQARHVTQVVGHNSEGYTAHCCCGWSHDARIARRPGPDCTCPSAWWVDGDGTHKKGCPRA